MAEGPGKYDLAAGVALELTGGQAVILIVLNGNDGHGFSVVEHETQATGWDIAQQIPDILYNLANDMTKDLPTNKG